MTTNTAYVQIRFSDKPGDSIRESLKRRGFRFTNGIWVRRATAAEAAITSPVTTEQIRELRLGATGGATRIGWDTGASLEIWRSESYRDPRGVVAADDDDRAAVATGIMSEEEARHNL